MKELMFVAMAMNEIDVREVDELTKKHGVYCSIENGKIVECNYEN